ncbi:outer membrane lipoprotein chaperone LolA [Vibrio stylophorae]|nr:outer membrane lipoprotein chaperone LolA [Vibrio stylophorae]
MKKLMIGALALLPLSQAFAGDTERDALIARLNQTDAFTANFDQVVTSPEGEVVMKGQGKAWLKRPSFFRWHTLTPDENLLVSDGQTLWYFNPFVEQVTAMWLKDATEQTPLVLITQNNPADWQNYSVTQKGDTFTLTPKVAQSNQGTFTVTVNDKGQVKGLAMTEQDGQLSKFTFNHFQATMPAASQFQFTVPEGVELDDQRQ